MLICSISLTAGANTADSKPSEPANTRDEFIAPLYGQWEGTVDYEYFENATSNKKYSKPLKIEITKKSLKVYGKDQKGEWVKAKNYTKHFKFSFRKNTLAGHFLKSGEDDDGIWVESQTMYVTLKDDNSILFYTIRSVNNTSIKNSTPGTKWNEVGVGELKKNDT